MPRPQRDETPLRPETLALVRHAGLRAEAARALERGEPARLVVGAQGTARVETVVLGAAARAAQSAGESVVRGEWKGGRLVADEGGHLLDADGFCFCRSCEAAGGYCVDDDE